MASQIRGGMAQEPALRAIASAQVAAGQKEEALATLKQADEAADKVADLFRPKLDVLIASALGLVEAGEKEVAMAKLKEAAEEALNVNEKRLIDVVGGEKTMIFRGITTSQKNQLDHILGYESAKPVYATSYLNFISDHFAITLRVSLNETGFVDDPRLKNDSGQTEGPIHQSPVSTPKKSRRKPAAGTPSKKRRC